MKGINRVGQSGQIIKRHNSKADFELTKYSTILPLRSKRNELQND